MTKKTGKAIIIDDDEYIRLSLKMFLEQYFEEVECLDDPRELTPLLNRKTYDIALLDMNFRQGDTSGKEGLYWLERLLMQSPDTNVILITAYGDVGIAVEAIKKGAFDFIVKPWQNEKLLATMSAAMQLGAEKKKVKKLISRQHALTTAIESPYNNIIGDSEAMQGIHRTIEKVAGTDADILILGENGTGKELIAREIHRKSARANEVFISIDVGALPETLFESELFGHVKGAYTDAREDRTGRFEAADGGTIFLDEIGNIPLHQQSRLLSVLQNRCINRVGSNERINIDVRVICATNGNIKQMVKAGDFREDLLYRINTIEITLPPLRERTEDIPQLTDYFLDIFNRKYNKNAHVDNRLLGKMHLYSWPGNIRELQHAIERAVIMCDEDCLSPEDLPFPGAASTGTGSPEDLNLEKLEAWAILSALKKFQGNVSHAANELGLSRGAMYRRMEKYGL
ncbi:MAG: sigma-54 dependent transcriptional regulator [Cyclobacteriaceae bacterium]|nr:sigma-54 dependent transcriptional regulator [Cyclobacteriaceae bacterium]